jgi:hypothetical protein
VTGLRLNDGTAVAQAGGALAIKEMGVNARDLRRRIGAQAKLPPTTLVYELKGAQIHGLTCAREKGLKVLQHGRHDQLVSKGTRAVEEHASQLFNLSCLIGQNIGEVVGKNPSGHGLINRGETTRYCTAQRAASQPMADARIKRKACV